MRSRCVVCMYVPTSLAVLYTGRLVDVNVYVEFIDVLFLAFYGRTSPIRSPSTMPVPRTIIEQIKQIIPPLNGTLHKGQSGGFGSFFSIRLTVCRQSRCPGWSVGVSVHRLSPENTGEPERHSYTGAPFFAAISALRLVRCFYPSKSDRDSTHS